MAKPRPSFQKANKERAKRQKREEKLRRKLDRRQEAKQRKFGDDMPDETGTTADETATADTFPDAE